MNSTATNIIDLNQYGPQGKQKPFDLGAFLSEAVDVLRKHGLDVDAASLDTSGKMSRCPLDGKPKSKDGSYWVRTDARPTTWWMNYVTGEAGSFGAGGCKVRLTDEDRAQIEVERQRRAEERAKEQERAAGAALKFYELASQEGGTTHLYAVRKGLDFGPQVKRRKYLGHDCLIVPLYSADGPLMTVQAIGPGEVFDGNRDKTLFKGGKKEGGFFPVGPTFIGAARVGIAEGLATAAAIHAATGLPCLMAVDKGNLIHVARVVRELAAPGAEIIVFADDDQPDPDGIAKAEDAARAVGGVVAVPAMGKKADFWDVWHERGPEAVRECIEVAQAADQAEEVNLDDGSDLKPTEFTLDGFLGVGVLYVAGAHGVGKSSLLVPLVAVITGELEGSGVGAFLKRKVLYFAEDPDQILRVRYGLEKHCGLRRNGNFILRQTRRMSDAHLRGLVASLVKEHTITGPNRYPVKPLIVFDTLSASFELQDENSNSEAAKFIAAIKESGGSTPVWLIGHIAKALLRADVEAMCGRGAGAWEADSQGTAFIFSEPDGAQDLRYLRTRKRRFEADFLEVRFATSLDQEVRQAPWGEVQTVRIRYGIPERSDEETRKQDVQDVQTIKQAGQDARARELILDFLQGEYAPVSKNEIEQYTTEQRSPRESARRALLEMVRVGEVEMVEKYLAKDGKARKNGYQLRDKFASEV